MKPLPFELSGRCLLAISLMGTATHCLSAPVTASRLPDPILNQGLWEVVTIDSTRKDFEAMERLCVGTKVQEGKLADKNFETKRRTCKINDVQPGKDLISYTAICTTDYGVTVTSKIAFRGNFVREFVRTEIVSVDLSADMDRTQTQRYKYNGPCPKVMATGETILQIRDQPTKSKWNRYNPPQPNQNSPDLQK